MARRLEIGSNGGGSRPDRRPRSCPTCGGAVVPDASGIDANRTLKRLVCRTCGTEYGTVGRPVRPY